jgi:hypothetical protein
MPDKEEPRWNPAPRRAAPEPAWTPDLAGGQTSVPAPRGRWTPEAFDAPSLMVEAPRPVRRVNVNFSDQAYETLEVLARRSGKSMSEVLREAIALKAWFDRERAEGNRILVERPNGQVRELISV